MKRFILLALIVAILAIAPPQRAYAATAATFAMPVGRECYLFSQKNSSSALFAVPYTYCVEILRDDGEWYYARYAADEGEYRQVYGYCKKEQFTPVENLPTNLYLNKIITVSFSAGDSSGGLTPPPEMQVDAAYYGVYRLGASYYSYVYCRGAFCYVEGANDDYPLNEFPEADGGDGSESERTNAQNSPSWRVGLTIFLCILIVALAVIAMLFFSSKKPKDG